MSNCEPISLECNEQVDLEYLLPSQCRGVISGIVLDGCNKPVHDAVVKLFQLIPSDCKKPRLKPLTHAFSDCDGVFVFGPLNNCYKYVVKVWKNDVLVKEPKVIRPCCSNHNTNCDSDDFVKEYCFDRDCPSCGFNHTSEEYIQIQDEVIEHIDLDVDIDDEF